MNRSRRMDGRAIIGRERQSRSFIGDRGYGCCTTIYMSYTVLGNYETTGWRCYKTRTGCVSESQSSIGDEYDS